MHRLGAAYPSSRVQNVTPPVLSAGTSNRATPAASVRCLNASEPDRLTLSPFLGFS
jgi:hypothetical protein